MKLQIRIKGVIFDQDGLMFDTERRSALAWEKAAEELGVVIPESFLSTCRGSSPQEVKTRFLQYFGSDFPFDEIRSRKQRYYQKDIRGNGLPVKPGLTELLSYLKEKKYKIALATASGRTWSLDNLRIAGVYQYFDAFVCGDMVTACKPDPEIFLKAAEFLSEQPKHCLVLEDSINGVKAALNGGFPIIMVPDLTEPDAGLLDRMTARCDSLLTVRDWLEEQHFD